MPKSEENDYKEYIVRRVSNVYWSVEEKIKLMLFGLSKCIAITTLCRINNLTPVLYYEWKELFLSGAQDGLLGKETKSQREVTCEKKVEALERFIGELILEKERLKKLKDK